MISMSATSLSYSLSKALARGREVRARKVTREEILYCLLTKRAVASREGLDDLEGALRNQIRLALPFRSAAELENDLT